MQWAGLPTLKFQEAKNPQKATRDPACHRRFKAERLPFTTGFTHVEFTFSIDFKRTLLFAQFGLQAWQDLVEIKDDPKKYQMLRDAARREQACKSWDAGFANNNLTAEALQLRESENGVGPVGVTLAEFMRVPRGSSTLQMLLRSGSFATEPDSLVLTRGCGKG